MKRIEFIELNEVHTTAIEFSNLHPIRNSLYIFYKDLFGCEPVLMVTDVFNTCNYVKIVPSSEFIESVDAYLSDTNDVEEDELNEYKELINFNSKMLKDIL